MARLSTLLLALIVLAAPLFAAGPAEEAAERPYFAVTSGNGVTLTFDELNVNWETLDSGVLPQLPGAGELGLAGGPRLPVFSEMIAVPAGKDLVLDEVVADWIDLGVIEYAHDPGNDLDEDADADPAIFEQAFARSQETALVSSTGRWRDLRVANVAVQPLRVDPETGHTFVASNLTVKMRYVAAEDDGYDPPGFSEAMLPLYEQYVINAVDYIDYDEVRRGTYLIIYPEPWEDFARELADWRTRTGFTVMMSTTGETGNSFSSLHQYIEDVYNTADPALEYVVFIGDMDTPANIATSYVDPGVPFPIDPQIATDHKYTYDLTASETLENRLPRYFVGRISVDSPIELQTIVAKIKQYEMTPFQGNAERWTRGATIADKTYAISTALTQDWVKFKMHNNGFTNVEQVVRDFGDDPGAQGIADAINANVSWVAYRGFGSHTSWAGPYFYNSDIDSRIFNADNVPVITSMVCGGGAFDELGGDDPCFGEKWIRHGSPTNLKGAVAFVAPSEIDTHTRWNNMMLGGWYTGLFDQGLRSIGQCLASAKLQLYNNYPLLWNPFGTNETSVWFYFHTYNILGDPALQLRAEMPKVLDVSHETEIEPNATHLEVLVLDDFGTPIDHAMVAVTKDESELIGSARSKANGVADVLLTSAPAGGQIDLTVTRPDAEPYIYTLSGGDDGVVSMIGTQTIEIASDGSTNGDGNLNPGELINPQATFRVEAPGGVNQILVSMSVAPEFGDMETAYQVFGATGEDQLVQTNNLRLRLRQNVEAGTRIPVTFKVYTNAGNMTHLAHLQGAVAPKLRFGDVETMDEFYPGDTSEINLRLSNFGDVGTGAITGYLTVDDPFVTVIDNEGHWTGIPPGMEEIGMNEMFQVELHGDAYPGHTFHATAVLTTQRGHIQRVDFEVTADGAEPSAPTGPWGPGYFIFEDIDTGYDQTPDFTWHSVVGDGGFDVGLDDEGNNEDDVVSIDLPFAFPYWDQEYTEVSICSNGWISFGHSDFYFFRNRPLPGALTPFASIMPLWDDLIFASNNSGVYGYHDQDNGWYVIEWHRVWHYNDESWWGDPDGPPMSFQILLLDPAMHGLEGGLGKIAILYHEDIQNDDGEENFLTMGMTSPDGREGLQYQFATTTVPTGGGVQDNRQMMIAATAADWYSDPNINFAPPLVQLNAGLGGNGAGELTVTNTGGRATTFEIWPEGIGYDWGVPGEDDDLGGPDNIGYRWYDSREPFGPQYQWLNIAQPGNLVTLNDGDDNGFGSLSDAIDLPWDFPYYGERYDQVWISESGYLTFIEPDEGYGAVSNTALPRPYAPHAAIFPFWDNIGTDMGGDIYAKGTGNAFIVTWNEVGPQAGTDTDEPRTFQLVLTPDGAIHVQYGAMEGNLSSATIGLQDATGDEGLLTAFNTSVPAYLNADDLSLRFSPGMPWMDLAPMTYSLGPDESVTVNIAADATDLAPGLQHGRLLVIDKLTNNAQALPVDFMIADGELGYAPLVASVPGESINPDDGFGSFFLDPYVEDWDNADAEIQWVAYGTDSLQVTIDPETRQVDVAAHPQWVGPATVTFRAYDPELNYETMSIDFDQFGRNDAPRFDAASPDALGEVSLDQTIAFSVTGNDPEGDEIEYEWYHNGGFVGDGESVNVTFTSMGDNTVRVMANDGQGNVSELVWTGYVFDNAVSGDAEAVLPEDFALESVYPNPFNGRVVLRYALPQTANVNLIVYNLLGQEVTRIARDAMPAGRHEIALNAEAWASGLYFLDWRAGDTRQVRKAVLLK